MMSCEVRSSKTERLHHLWLQQHCTPWILAGSPFWSEFTGDVVCMATQHIARVWINRVRLPILLAVSWTGKMNISLSAFAPENLVSRDRFGNPDPRQPAHLHTQAESGAYLRGIPPEFRGGVRLFNNFKPPYDIGRSRFYRVTQLRTDGVHCRESRRHRASKPQGSSERVLPWQVTMDQLTCALFPTPTIGMKWL